MDKKKIAYSVHTDINEMEKLGLHSVPAIAVDGELMNYNQAMEWITHQQGEIK